MRIPPYRKRKGFVFFIKHSFYTYYTSFIAYVHKNYKIKYIFYSILNAGIPPAKAEGILKR